MPKKALVLVASFVLLFSLFLGAFQPAAFAAPDFANDHFKTTWQYSDKLVDEVPGAGRGFTWGPNTFGTYQEDYADAPGSKRQVQYFDKSRMELSADGTYVTNGLLTKELVTGSRQDGDAKFTQLAPSQVQVAGDDNSAGGNSVAPTYASFRKVITFNGGENAAQNLTGQAAKLSLDKAGNVNTLDNPPAQVRYGFFEATLHHNIPEVFYSFMYLKGRIWNGSAYTQGNIYTDNPIANVFGLPISEGYWARAVVGGQEKDVLVQLFERRVLTYTPTNDDPYKVEMGNIGQHYRQWRYGSAPPPSTTTPPPALTPVNYQIEPDVPAEQVARIKQGIEMAQKALPAAGNVTVKAGGSLTPDGKGGADTLAAASPDGVIVVYTAGKAWAEASATDQIQTLVHEYYHLVQFYLAKSANDDTGPDQVAQSGPGWMHEGSAEYLGYKVTSDNKLTDFGSVKAQFKDEASQFQMPLKSLETDNQTKGAGRAPYALGFMAIDFLSTTQNVGDSLQKYYTAIGNGKTWQEAFQTSFGMSINDFYTNFENYRAANFPAK